MLKDPSRDWYTIKEAAERMGTSRTVVYRLLREGTLSAARNPFYAGRGPVHLDRRQVDDYIRARTQATEGA